MSRIDDLIARLCPDGVPYAPLSEVFSLKNGYTPSRADTSLWAGGTVPWFRMDDVRANGRVLSASQEMVTESAVKGGHLFPADSLIVATSATIGEHALIRVPHLCNQRFTNLAVRREYLGSLDMRFAYYYAFRLDEWCRSNVTMSSFASVDMAGFRRFPFPLPPLEVQREIVRVLDTFSQLEAELEAELEARRRQYEYYRDALLTGDESSTRRVALCDLLREPLANGRSVPGGSGYPVLRLTALHGPVVDTREQKRGAWTMNDGRRFRIEAGDLLVARGNGSRDLVARASMVEDSEEVAFPDTMIRIRPNLALISQRYLYYQWESRSTRSSIARVAKPTSGVWKVSQEDIGGVKLPVPPIEQQERIVATLDSFDALVNDLSIGLPAELAARRKQYAHYRDRLLTFKEKGA